MSHLPAGLAAGIEPAGEQKQMFDSRLTRPGTQSRPSLSGIGLTPCQRSKHFAPAILSGMIIRGGKHHLDTVACGKKRELLNLKSGFQLRQAGGNRLPRYCKARDFLAACVPVREAHDPDLVHACKQSMAQGVEVSPKRHGDRKLLIYVLSAAAPAQ